MSNNFQLLGPHNGPSVRYEEPCKHRSIKKYKRRTRRSRNRNVQNRQMRKCRLSRIAVYMALCIPLARETTSWAFVIVVSVDDSWPACRKERTLQSRAYRCSLAHVYFAPTSCAGVSWLKIMSAILIITRFGESYIVISHRNQKERERESVNAGHDPIWRSLYNERFRLFFLYSYSANWINFWKKFESQASFSK